MKYSARKLPLLRGANLDILRADLHIHRHIFPKACGCAGDVLAQKVYQMIPHHDAINDVAVPDEVRHKGIFRLVVHVLRGADLLDPALVNDHHCVGHGKGFLLVVGDKDKGNAKFLFYLYQLPLHVLPQL